MTQLDFTGPHQFLSHMPGGVPATTAALDEVFVGEVRRLALGARYVTSACTARFAQIMPAREAKARTAAARQIAA